MTFEELQKGVFSVES